MRARAVLQNVADGIVTAGEGGLIESFNQSARRLFGYREDEVIGQPLQLHHRARATRTTSPIPAGAAGAC